MMLQSLKMKQVMCHAKLILKAAGNSLSKVDILTEKSALLIGFALLTSQRELNKF